MREFIIIVSSFYYFTAISTRIVFKWLTVFLFIIVFFHFCIGFFSRGFYGHVTDCLCQNQYNMYHSKVNLCNFAGILTWHAVKTFLEKIRFSLKRDSFDIRFAIYLSLQTLFAFRRLYKIKSFIHNPAPEAIMKPWRESLSW